MKLSLTISADAQRDNSRMEDGMRKLVFIAGLAFGVTSLMASAGIPLDFAAAHEGHKAECNETAINAANIDIQEMDEGDAKTRAMKEMQLAEEMMAKKDMDGCTAHLHKAMEAMEE